ncbi:MAG: glycosyltransferase family 2 protein [Deltaproteobacteria bacterium]|nr:glycosyltransferase family 2 protein [Candidatus Zymogenaceae bacterium]
MNIKTHSRTASTRDNDAHLFVSVVVATIDRGGLLIQTVRGLLENDYPDFEVIVVDQTPRPERDVLEFMENGRARIRYIRRRQPGLPDARNAGVAAARGDVILFVDDDVIPGRRLICAHGAAYGRDGVGGVAGRILPPGNVPQKTQKRHSRIAKIKFWGLIIRDHFDADIPTGADHVRGCNMSFLKRAIDDAGGFDGRFGGSAHLEETDIALRVRAKGYRLVFEPAAVLVHLREPAGGCRPKNLQDWFFWYGHNSCLFYRKNYPASLFPLFAAWFTARLPFSAIKNRRLGVIPWALKGFIKGLDTYRRGAT